MQFPPPVKDTGIIQKLKDNKWKVLIIIIVAIVIIIIITLSIKLTETPKASTNTPTSEVAIPNKNTIEVDTNVYNIQECANEGSTCKIGPSGKVRYYAKNIAGKRFPSFTDIECNNNTFGDPTLGVIKACYTSSAIDKYPFNKCTP